jgi:hypothetical protein
MTRISISICPTALQYDNGDTYDSDKLLDAIRLFALTRHPGATITTLQIGHRQGDEWAKVDGDEEAGADLLGAFFDAHGTHEDLFVDDDDDNAPKIIRQTGGSVTVGDEYNYDFITRDASGSLRFFSQDCIVNEDGYIEADNDPLDLTNSVDSETLAEWAGYWTLDTVHGDPADCMVAPGEMLVGHRLMRRS